MKRNYFWMMLLVLASVLGFASCSSSDDPADDTFVGAKNQLEVGALDLELYDITITYTDLLSGTVQTQKLISPSWSYDCVSSSVKKPSEFVLKVEGTAKSNAKEIAKSLAAKGNKMAEGINYNFKYGIFKDLGMQHPAGAGFTSSNELMGTIPADRIEDFLEKHPTRTFFDSTSLVK